MLLIGKRKVKEMKSMLKIKFDMKDLGSAKKILGINIERSRNDQKIFLH